MKIIKIWKDSNILESFAREYNGMLIDDEVKIPKQFGLGYIKAMCLPIGLGLFFSEHKLRLECATEVLNTEDSEVFLILVNISSKELTIKRDEEWVKLHYRGPNSILFFSPGSSMQMSYPANEAVKTLAISFKKETIWGIIDDHEIRSGLSSDRPFLFLDEAVPEAENFIRSLIDDFESKPVDKFRIYINALNLLKLTLYRTFIIKERYNSSGLLSDDVEKLFAIRNKLLESSNQNISISQLAHESGMSQSKLTKLFKQVFNRSVFQFAQKAKILKAKDLLNSRKYNVSQVGYMVGYANLTHFARAFKKYYKMNPNEYLRSLLNQTK